jgi:hypothetical protein
MKMKPPSPELLVTVAVSSMVLGKVAPCCLTRIALLVWLTYYMLVAMYQVDNTPLVDENLLTKLCLWGLLISTISAHRFLVYVFALLTLTCYHYKELTAHTASIVEVEKLSQRTQLLLTMHMQLCNKNKSKNNCI